MVLLKCIHVLSIFRLIFISIVYDLHKESFGKCQGGNYLKTYCIGIFVLMCVCILITCVIVFISSRGSIMNPSPRRRLVKILYVRFVLAFSEILWNILGTYWTFGTETICEHSTSVEIAVKITVIVFWILAVSVFIAFLIVFGVLGGRKKHKHEGLYSRESGASVSAKNKWERR